MHHLDIRLSKPKLSRTHLFSYLFGLVILVVSLVFFGLSTQRPYMGVDLSRNQQGWVIGAVDVTGLAISHGVKVGDRPVEINGEPAQVFLQKYEKEGIVWGPLLHKLVVIDSNGNLITVNIEGSAQSVASVMELATRFLVCLVFWIIGLYVFIKRPQNRAALLLYLVGLCMGLVMIGNMASVRAIPSAVYVEIAATIIGPWLLVHFFLVLPEERTRINKSRRVYLIYLPAAVTIILFVLIGFENGQPVMWFRSLRLLEYGAGFIAAAVVAILNYKKSSSPRTRQQMKIVLFGCLAALIPILVLNVLPQATQGQGHTITPAGFSILFIMFIPVALGYAVVTRRLMDIDLVIRRSVVYGLITVVMAVILSAAILLAVAFQKSLGLAYEIAIALALGALATALFGPTKRGIEFLVDKFFYKDRYDYRQIIQNLSAALNLLKDYSEVSRLIVGTVVRALNLAGASLFVKTEAGNFEASGVQGSFADAASQKQLSSLLAQRDENIQFPNTAEKANPDVAFIIPLEAGGKEAGVLCLSPKKNRQAFSSDDLYLLQGLSSVAALSLRNVMLIHDVSTRDTFVSIASHELRTPLTSIIGFTELLMKRDPPENLRKEWLKYILDNGQRIVSLVDDLLNVTRIRSGKVSMKLEKVNIPALLKDTLTITQAIATKHEFNIITEPGLHDALADYDKLGQIVGNLLNNAIKYSPKGGHITVMARNNPEKHKIIISVADEGMGISAEDSASLFNSFHRIKRPETQGIRGSGLGLYIAKEWTEAMGGEIWLESELNKGSTFYIGIPEYHPGEIKSH